MARLVEKYLEFTPLLNSEHVYVNGVEQRIGQDYTIENGSYVVLPATRPDGSPGACESGDKLEVLYAHLSVPGSPPPELITNPDEALPGCFGTTDPFPWQSDHEYGAMTLETAQKNVAMQDGEYLYYTLTQGHIVSGVGVSWDGWMYFRKPDGCIEPFNFITGSIWGDGYGPSDGNVGPFPIPPGTQNHPVPSGSKLVGASMSIYYAGNHDTRLYWERRP